MKLRPLPLLLAFCLCAGVAGPAAAALYKWTDANGRVVYSDQPPADQKAETLKPSVAPSDPNAMRELLSKDNEIRKRQTQRVEEDAKTAKADADGKRKTDQCMQTRGRIKSLRDDPVLYRFNEKGERVVMESRERQRAVTDNEKILKDLNCPPV